jgi:hypothetical protein
MNVTDMLIGAYKGNPTLKMAQAIIQAQRERLLIPALISDETRKIDPRTASSEQMKRALQDCQFYWQTAYPETENDLIEWIEASCEEALKEKSPGNHECQLAC